MAPAQALAELYRVLVRKAGRSAVQARQAIETLTGAAHIAATTAEILADALDLAGQSNLQIFDAIVLTAAAGAGCQILCSEDLHDGYRWRGMVVSNPFGAKPDRRIAPMLTP